MPVGPDVDIKVAQMFIRVVPKVATAVFIKTLTGTPPIILILIKMIKKLLFFKIEHKVNQVGGRHSSVVSSAPTILQPRVRIPSTPSMLFQFVLLKLYRENNENKQKRGLDWPIFKKK